jgi:outer membrane protein
MSSRHLVAIAIACLFVLVPARAARAEGVAVIDLQGAVMQTEDGIRAQATLKKLFDKRQQDLDGKQTQLARMKQDIQRQQHVLSREALTRRMEVWQREMAELQAKFLDYQKELAKKQNELTKPILTRMVGLIARVAKQNAYDMVLDRAAAPYARPDLDLTDRLVQMYNAGEQ